LFYDSPWGKEWRFSGPEGEQIVRVSGNLQTNNVVTLRSAAILGQGLISAPVFMVASDLKAGALVPVLTRFSTTESSVDAIYPNRRYLAAKVRSFIDLAARHFRDAVWSDPEGLHGA
jgi:DNA-binding transcriptional LysR family regulator